MDKDFHNVRIKISNEKYQRMLNVMSNETYFDSRIGKGTLINLGLDLLFNELESKSLEQVRKELVK